MLPSSRKFPQLAEKFPQFLGCKYFSRHILLIFFSSTCERGSIGDPEGIHRRLRDNRVSREPFCRYRFLAPLSSEDRDWSTPFFCISAPSFVRGSLQSRCPRSCSPVPNWAIPVCHPSLVSKLRIHRRLREILSRF